MASKKSSPKKSSSFKIHPFGVALLVFASIFGIVGSYIVFFSKAATPLTWSPPSGYTSYPVYNVGVTTANNTNIDGKGGDMFIKLPTKSTGPISIKNCRNVVIIGGQITIPPNTGATNPDIRGIYINGCTGTVHIEGVYIDGSTPTAEADGIAISAPNAIVQVQNVRINKLYGGQDTAVHNHSDIIQPWGGVKELRVDHLSGTTNFQGFQINDDTGHIGKAIIKNANIGDSGVAPPTSNGGYYLWVKCGTGTTYSFENFYVQPRSGRTLGNSLWDGGCGLNAGSTSATYANSAVSGTILKGNPSSGDFVPAGSVGIGYSSIGYAVSNTTPTPPPTTPTTPMIPTTPTTPTVPTTPVTPPSSNPTTPPAPTPAQPVITPSTPPNSDGQIGGTVTIQTPIVSKPAKTEVYVDGDFVSGGAGGEATLNTALLSNGNHTVTVKTTDVNGAVTEASQDVDVNNSLVTQVLGQVTTKKGKTITAIVVAIIVVVTIIAYKKISIPVLGRR
ncbi:MAG: hypothetical protein U0491_02335 [Candidatus Saccharimonadales bacterium]